VQLPDFLQGQKKDLCEFESSYDLAIHAMEIFEIFSTSSQITVLENPMVTCVQKCFFLKFGGGIRNDNFGVFLVKTCNYGTIGVPLFCSSFIPLFLL